jgi:hypothetical protein
MDRIPADPEYLRLLGRALYNFTYLEWGIIYTIVKLSTNGFESVPRGETAQKIARALTRAIAETRPPLPTDLRLQLIKLDERYRAGIKVRNRLLHGHPYTAADGSQRLGGIDAEGWTPERVAEAATTFAEVSTYCWGIFYGPLAAARP